MLMEEYWWMNKQRDKQGKMLKIEGRRLQVEYWRKVEQWMRKNKVGEIRYKAMEGARSKKVDGSK